jgi:hypothetical protein
VKVVLAKPDDFFLSTYFAVTCPESTGPLTNRQAIFDDPRQIAWLNAERPFSAKFL